MGFSRKEYWSGLPCPCPWRIQGMVQTQIKLMYFTFPALAGESFTTSITTCCCSVAKSCPTLGNPMDYSMPGFPVSQSLLKFKSVELVMPANNLILCHPFLLLPSVFPKIKVFSSESTLHIRWPKYWTFSVSINPSN